MQTTLPSESTATALAREIVQLRFGACVQLQTIRSFYIWQEQTHDESEWLLNIKTRHALYPALQAWLLERHPYDTPEIICLPIEAGNAAYLSWVEDNTHHTSEVRE